MTLLAAIAGALFVFLASATLILLLVGPTMLLQPRRRNADFYRALGRPVAPSDLNLVHEDFSVTTDDGFALQGWFIRADAPTRGTLVYLHGVADCKIDGLRFAKFFHDRQFNVVLYDSRRHGTSGGTF
jgi:uncharacterized protein